MSQISQADQSQRIATLLKEDKLEIPKGLTADTFTEEAFAGILRTNKLDFSRGNIEDVVTMNLVLAHVCDKIGIKLPE